jgi:hypothetical protein
LFTFLLFHLESNIGFNSDTSPYGLPLIIKTIDGAPCSFTNPFLVEKHLSFLMEEMVFLEILEPILLNKLGM